VTSSHELNVPFERLGDYQVLAPISEGGMASVWLGRRATPPTEFAALKVIRAEHGRNKDFVAMLVDEAGIASRLSHPHILTVRALGHDGKQHFLVMELLRGHTLRELWNAAHAQGKRLPLEAVAWLGARVADALHYAHVLTDQRGAALNVVHRDVNPANIFITRDGVPKLIDFGLAKARDCIASTAIGVVKGKLAYLAPEQTHGRPADRRSDVFALGVTLWEITLDRRLFLDDTDVETVRRVREAQIPDPTMLAEDYPPALAKAVVRALAREPDERWQTAAELRDALDAFVRSGGRAVDASTVRSVSNEFFGDRAPAAWERLVDGGDPDQEPTRIWEEREEGARAEPVPFPLGSRRRPWQDPSPKLLSVVAGASGLCGAVLVGLVSRGCSIAGAADGEIERRLARVEGVLAMRDAGPAPASGSLPAGSAPIASADDDRSASCALAKVASYQAWQEAFTKAKANAAPAQAACVDLWGDSKKQACYHAALAQVRATQAARDTVVAGGGPAHEAVKSARDDPKNEAIARARAASEAAFAACDDDGGA
jgi:serine/threonine-protein kinase